MCKCCFLWESHLVPISWKMLAIVVFVVSRSLFGSFLRYPCSQQDCANDSTAFSLDPRASASPAMELEHWSHLQSWSAPARLPEEKNMRVFFSSFPDDFFSPRQVWIFRNMETWNWVSLQVSICEPVIGGNMTEPMFPMKSHENAWDFAHPKRPWTKLHGSYLCKQSIPGNNWTAWKHCQRSPKKPG